MHSQCTTVHAGCDQAGPAAVVMRGMRPVGLPSKQSEAEAESVSRGWRGGVRRALPAAGSAERESKDRRGKGRGARSRAGAWSCRSLVFVPRRVRIDSGLRHSQSADGPGALPADGALPHHGVRVAGDGELQVVGAPHDRAALPAPRHPPDDLHVLHAPEPQDQAHPQQRPAALEQGQLVRDAGEAGQG